MRPYWDGLGAIGKRLLIDERDGAETHQAATAVADVLDVFFESPGGTHSSKLAGRIDNYWDSVVVGTRNPADSDGEECRLRQILWYRASDFYSGVIAREPWLPM
jgi:hypothetical protein